MNAPRASLGALIIQTGRICMRRAPLFGAVALGGLALQSALELGTDIPQRTFLGLSIILPLVTAVVYAFTPDEDYAGDARARWERAVERSWAVIVIDFLVAFLFGIGVTLVGAGDPANALLGALTLLLGAMLTYADVHAVFEANAAPLTIIPESLAFSLTLCYDVTTFLRALVLTAVQMLITTASAIAEHRLDAAHVPHAHLWAGIVPVYLVAVPLNVLTALVYLDAMRRIATRGTERAGGP